MARPDALSAPYGGDTARIARRWLIAGALLLWASAAFAQSCLEESEPNDTPPTAVVLADARCFVGDLSGQDQDAWMWDVTEADATVPWRLTIEGVPDQLTKVDVLRIAFTEDGTGVTAADTLLSYGTRDGRSATSEPFLVTPGERLFLGVSRSGGEGRYIVQLEPGRELRRGRGRLRADEHEGAFGAHGVLEGERELAWTLDEDTANRRWGLVLAAAVGARVEAELIRADGSRVGSLRAESGVGRLDALGLEPGRYTIRLRGPADAPATIVLDAEPQGVVTDGNEVEPNNGYEEANLLPLDAPLAGGGGDVDSYLIEIDAQAASRAWDLALEADGSVDLELRDADRELLLRRRGERGTVPALHLDEGRYWLRADGARDARYTLTMASTARADDGFEREPNDELRGATQLPENLGIRGHLGSQDVDVFRFETAGDPQLWRFQAIGDGAGEVTVYNGGGVRQHRARGDGRIRLDNVVLLAGTHFVSVGRGEGDYALRALPLGPAPDPEDVEPADPDVPLSAAPAASDDDPGGTVVTDVGDGADASAERRSDADVAAAAPTPPPGQLELEPNDDSSHSEHLAADVVHVGQMPKGDRDVYRFFLPGQGRVRVEFQNARGGEALVEILEHRDGRIMAREGERVVLDAALTAGDFFVRLRPQTHVEGFYQLRMTHLDPLAAPADSEPNDALPLASVLPATRVAEGVLPSGDSSDWYALPRIAAATEITLSLAGEPARVALFDADTGSAIPAVEDRATGETFEARYDVDAGVRPAARVTGNGAYRLQVEFGVDPDPGTLRPMPGGPAALEVAAPAIPVAAYWHLGQVVETSVAIRHEGAADTTYRLIARSSSPDAQVELPESVRVGAGDTVEVPVRVRLLDDLRDDAPLRVTIGAVDLSTLGTIDTARIQLDAACSADAVAPQRVSTLPSLLIGRFNVALDAFGAEVLDEGLADLNDGGSAPARGVRLPIGEPVTVRLAGGAAQRLVGTILDPYARQGPGGQLERFRIETSIDGTTFQPAFEGVLGTERREQAFVFAEPVDATHARLVPLSAHAHGDRAALGEWKLIAETPPVDAPNLLDPALGGNVVWANVDPQRFDASLAEDGEGGYAGSDRPRDLEWVLGFHHGRAAQIARLAWTPHPGSGEAVRHVEVSASMTGPAGPFEPLGAWDVERGPLVFDAPVWARYLRFVAPGDGGELPGRLLLPDAIAAYERAPDDGYRSILGEWGAYRREAAWEWSKAAQDPPRDVVPPDAGDERSHAAPLASGASASGTVAVAEDVDWYRMSMPEGDNLLEIVLEGAPTVDYRYALYDSEGEEVFFEEQQEADRVRLTAFVETGDVFLELYEPKRSVIFAWDTSGSVSPYQAITYNSLARFARDVDPEREFVQLLAYDHPSPKWLLPHWSGDPVRVQTAINEFDRRADSSDSFNAMTVATEALAKRDGTRAILLMTDAETGGFRLAPRLWSALAEARPRVFSFEISSAGSDWTQDLMQNWAAVRDGHYDYARNVGDFDVGFRRAACQLRRPKTYRVDVTTRAEEPPGPGRLEVVPAEGAPRPAVEVILDASGSMGVLLPDGTPRIDAARDTLQRLVADVLEEGAPFALRAFGHVMPSTCDQELVLPLAPLDRERAVAAIAGIEPKLLSQTPIADALRAAAEDLSGAGGPVAVVLITDGEESCGGDPEAALAELRAAGVDVTLSIVSLALEDPETEDRFAALAELGGGAYTDIGDPQELGAAIEASLAVPFEVLAADGVVVAHGSVGGDAVALPAGIYTVRVAGSPPTLLRDVRVPGDGAVRVAVDRR